MRTLTVLVCVGTLVAGCEEKLRPSISSVNVRDLPAQESWNSTVTFSDSAKIKAILWAGYIAVFSDKQYTLLHDSVHIDFYDEQERRSSVLTAEKGRVNDRTKDLAAYEHVVVVSEDGTVLKTDSLFWDSATRKIQTEAAVEIISPSEHIYGQGLVSDQGLKDYRISRVTGQAVIKDE